MTLKAPMRYRLCLSQLGLCFPREISLIKMKNSSSTK